MHPSVHLHSKDFVWFLVPCRQHTNNCPLCNSYERNVFHIIAQTQEPLSLQRWDHQSRAAWDHVPIIELNRSLACLNTGSAAGLVKRERLKSKVTPSHTCQVFTSDLCVMPYTEIPLWTNPSLTPIYPLWNPDSNITNQDLFSLSFISTVCLRARFFFLLQVCAPVTCFSLYKVLVL